MNHPQGASAPKAPIPPSAPKTTHNASAASVNAEVAKEAKAPKTPKAPKEKKESNFAKVYPEAAKITVKVEKNPKREGTKAHGTFALYRNGMTVGEFIKAGGFYAALAWDVGHGFVAVG